jgi:hypothetical protein
MMMLMLDISRWKMLMLWVVDDGGRKLKAKR